MFEEHVGLRVFARLEPAPPYEFSRQDLLAACLEVREVDWLHVASPLMPSAFDHFARHQKARGKSVGLVLDRLSVAGTADVLRPLGTVWQQRQLVGFPLEELSVQAPVAANQATAAYQVPLGENFVAGDATRGVKATVGHLVARLLASDSFPPAATYGVSVSEEEVRRRR